MSTTTRPDRLHSAPSTANHIGGFDANPIEQLHARTVQRILTQYPEYTSRTHPAKRSKSVTMSSARKQTMSWDGKSDSLSLDVHILCGQ